MAARKKSATRKAGRKKQGRKKQGRKKATRKSASKTKDFRFEETGIITITNLTVRRKVEHWLKKRPPLPVRFTIPGVEKVGGPGNTSKPPDSMCPCSTNSPC
jgi:hypothetical protein